jgi:hypothetical protein
MTWGEFLTKLAIWLSMLAYVAGALAFARNTRQSEVVTRLLWTAGCASMLAHISFALHFYHRWSQESAYLETARQTNEVIGLNWGGGVYINYFLLIGWLIDISWWWLCGLDSYRRRPVALVISWHAFLLFILFNATVVFKSGAVRWAGLLLCFTLAAAWLMAIQNSSNRVLSTTAK